MTSPRRHYTKEELQAIAIKLDAMGYATPAALARRGLPGLAAYALKREMDSRRGHRQQDDAKASG